MLTNFFLSYKRSQFTAVNDEKSISHSVNCGVPQRSVSGPLFFDLYTNDLHRAVVEDYVHLLQTTLLYFYGIEIWQH